MVKFSVVIPVHNKLPHLERSINSVLNQTFSDFELILVDDASTDGSSNKIKEFNDSRIRIYIRDTPGPGGYAARNLGIEKAEGEWVAFLDADDEWHPNHLEKMNDLSLIFPDVFVMGCGWITENKHGKEPSPFFKANAAREPFLIELSQFLQNGLSKQLPICTIVTCVKRNSPELLNLFPARSDAKRGGDLYAWLKLVCFHKQMAWSNHIGATYHIDSVNMVTKKSSFSIVNLSKPKYNELAVGLNNEEKVLLKKFFNFRIKNDLKASKIQGSKMENVLKNIQFRGDLINALVIILLWVGPVRLLSNLKNKIKR